jgi:hypothetical protein
MCLGKYAGRLCHDLLARPLEEKRWMFRDCLIAVALPAASPSRLTAIARRALAVPAFVMMPLDKKSVTTPIKLFTRLVGGGFECRPCVIHASVSCNCATTSAAGPYEIEILWCRPFVHEVCQGLEWAFHFQRAGFC